MIDFMIIALPRSGSTWAANWLTCGEVYCAHDPLWTVERGDIDSHVGSDSDARIKGVSCTGLWHWPDWLNAHPSRKLILHREIADVRRSMSRLGMPRIPLSAKKNLARIAGAHVPHADLFDQAKARGIWDFLTGGSVPFDAARHAQLCQMHIEPKFERVAMSRDVVGKVVKELSLK